MEPCINPFSFNHLAATRPLAKKTRPSDGISSMESLGASVHGPPYFNLGPLCCFTSPWWPPLLYSALQGHSKAARHLLFQAMALGGFVLPCSPKPLFLYGARHPVALLPIV
ncbi:hypothetical protein GOP47_0004597 [Adiantum capillus-veneris]|uniref:Uncharacterized protein n=1 Tax=Adiantum capillus-veneris TaxID=13818 RepID=A0A9D4ZMZ0_ADICA|nr:hypothetical protein GOP47_0004597 [Adiantum capillus-veneris]